MLIEYKNGKINDLFFWLYPAQPGFVIKLDFRNKFDIEPSPMCEYDYLEVISDVFSIKKINDFKK